MSKINHMRKKRSIKLPIVIAVIVIIIGAANYAYNQMPQRTTTSVTKVIDGDTIVVEGGERVRLLYIDTTERGENCYQESKDRLTELINGKEIIMEKSGEDRDKYGRLLRYIFVNNTLVNLVLVQEGLAHLYIYEQGPYHNQFLEAEGTAKEAGGCVWSSG